MHVSPDALDKLFEKYLVILNENPAESETLLFLTTSQLEFFKKHPTFKDSLSVCA